MVISNIGLTGILRLSTPILNAIYPPALVLILLSLAGERLAERRLVYPLTVGLTCLESVAAALQGAGLLPGLGALLDRIPLADLGLGWLLPAAAGLLLGLLLSPRSRRAG